MFLRFTSPPSAVADDFRRLQQAFAELLGNETSTDAIRGWTRGSFPAVNVVQTADEVQVYVFAPGVDAKSLNVSLHQGVLHISGQRALKDAKDVVRYRQERFSGTFDRSLSLSDDLDPDRVSANYRDGILQIRLHRHEQSKPRQIAIQ